MPQANAVYSVKTWSRKPWENTLESEISGAKLFRTEMIHVYEGDIEGESTIQYMFANNGQGQGNFIALEQVVGRVGDRSGSFVFQRTGTFGNGATKMQLVVLPGLSTGELATLSGQALLEVSEHVEHYPMTLEYTFE